MAARNLRLVGSTVPTRPTSLLLLLPLQLLLLLLLLLLLYYYCHYYYCPFPIVFFFAVNIFLIFFFLIPLEYFLVLILFSYPSLCFWFDSCGGSRFSQALNMLAAPLIWFVQLSKGYLLSSKRVRLCKPPEYTALRWNWAPKM